MKRYSGRWAVCGALLLVGMALVGCSRSTEDSASGSGAATTPSPQANASEQKKSGSMIDTSVQPAPAGVKTGLEGGRK